MLAKLNARKIQGLMVLVSGFILSAAFYLQYTKAMQPCPLCLMQRGMTIGVLVLALLGILSRRLSNACLLLAGEFFFSVSGAFFALRQLWLERMPVPETGMCMPGIEHLIDKLPWEQVLHAFIWGSATSCGEVTWSFLGFSMAVWSMFYFVAMVLLIGINVIARCKA